MYTTNFYLSVEELPSTWDTQVADSNILLSKAYLSALQDSLPANLSLKIAGVYKEKALIGGALFQLINIRGLGGFQNGVASRLKNYFIKRLIPRTLMLGNGMFTGRNAYAFDKQRISSKEWASVLTNVADSVRKADRSNVLFIKDFYAKDIELKEKDFFPSYHIYRPPPSMIVIIKPHWKTFEGYTKDLKKKYRDQYKRIVKKKAALSIRELSLEEIVLHSSQMYLLYKSVANKSDFNYFHLADNHFEALKKQLGSNFKVIGYFEKEELIGFFSLIENHEVLESFFLGYSSQNLKTHQIYLNMLYEMLDYAIKMQKKQLILGRTAMEIKSSIGAIPYTTFTKVTHANFIVRFVMGRLIRLFEPNWKFTERNPFK